MKIRFDLDTNRVSLGAGQNQPIETLEVKRGDYLSFSVQFYRDSQLVELAAGSTVGFVAKTSGKFDEATPKASGSMSGAPDSSSVYDLPVSLNTTGINSALASGDGNDGNDVESVTYGAEFYCVEAGRTQTSQSFAFKIWNDYHKGTEGAPTSGSPAYPSPELVPEFYSVTGLTGGSGKLDGRSTAASATPTGKIVIVIADPGDGGGSRALWYQLQSGTTAEASPWVIRPDDYAATTNERVWVRLA